MSGFSRAMLPPLALLIAATAQGQPPARTGEQAAATDVSRAGSRPSSKGPADRFTGDVRIDPLFDAKAPGRVSAGSVTFEPGARSAWHSHPFGQHLVILSGLGWTQVEGGAIVKMRPGDVIWCPPGVRHWHGATPTTAVTHMAIQEALDGRNVVWMEQVDEAQYRAGPGTGAAR